MVGGCDTEPASAAIVTESAPAPAPVQPRARGDSDDAAAALSRRGRGPAQPAGSVTSVPVSVWDPEVRDRVQKVLNPGTKIELAAEDFETPEEFVTVAHAARNTSVPFMVLKHRVLNEGQTLAEAIHELKPDLDAKAEVARTRRGAGRSGRVTLDDGGAGIIPAPPARGRAWPFSRPTAHRR